MHPAYQNNDYSALLKVADSETTSKYSIKPKITIKTNDCEEHFGTVQQR
jgi:hypothetical protein